MDVAGNKNLIRKINIFITMRIIGWVTNGLVLRYISSDGGQACTGDGCLVIEGTFAKYSPDFTTEIWRTTVNTGQFPGGKYQYASVGSTPLSMVYTECFGIKKVIDHQYKHVGYVASCGSGIEDGCAGVQERLILV